VVGRMELGRIAGDSPLLVAEESVAEWQLQIDGAEPLQEGAPVRIFDRGDLWRMGLDARCGLYLPIGHRLVHRLVLS
jgi:hypothetical protein